MPLALSAGDQSLRIFVLIAIHSDIIRQLLIFNKQAGKDYMGSVSRSWASYHINPPGSVAAE